MLTQHNQEFRRYIPDPLSLLGVGSGYETRPGYEANYANERARKLATPRASSKARVVLSVLAPTRARGITRHRFGQGLLLLTIIG